MGATLPRAPRVLCDPSRSEKYQVCVQNGDRGRTKQNTLAVDGENLITSGGPEQYVLWRPAEGIIDEVEEYGEDEFEAERLSVRQYLAGLGLAVHLVLIDLGLPAPCVSRVLACYGTEDTEDLLLSELHQAQAELFSRPSSSSRVRFVELL